VTIPQVGFDKLVAIIDAMPAATLGVLAQFPRHLGISVTWPPLS
jgi:hypothetical protein